MRRTARSLAVMICASVMLSAAVPYAAEVKITGEHPVKLEARPRCTQCHTGDSEIAMKPVGVFNHEADWVQRHRFYAPKSGQVCGVCHSVSFCTSCHAYKEELKPSLKDSDSPEQWLPHRGDYLFQHRIDGRIDPTSCFRCHGRTNNGSCRRCHK